MREVIWILALATFSTTVYAQLPVVVAPDQEMLIESDNPQLAANKKLVFDFWRKVLKTRNMKLAPQYMAEDYIQHNPNIPTGRQSFIDYFGKLERQPVKPKIDNLVAIVAEGDKVVLVFRRDLPDPKNPKQNYTTTWFDMFRIGDGKIIEHWDYGTKSAKCLNGYRGHRDMPDIGADIQH